MSTKLPDFGKHHKQQFRMSLNQHPSVSGEESVLIYDKDKGKGKKSAEPVRKAKREPSILRFFFRCFMFFFLLSIALAGGAGVGLAFSLSKLPDVTSLQYYAPIETTEIYDDKQQVMMKLHDEENRKIVELKQIPEHVRKAVLAIEDSRFFQHQGIDMVGMLRAFKANLDNREVIQGGSTLTQQITKNLFLTPERTVQRKLAEAWLSAKIEQKFSKPQILELYLNQVYWGHNAYGIEAAAQTYFGKPVSKLSIAEGAVLAGLLKGPEIFSPYHNKEKAKLRQKTVLARMVENRFISADTARKAFSENLRYPGIRHGQMRYPYFTSYVVSQLKQKYGDGEILKGGLKVYTTINSRLQAYAEQELTKHVHSLRYMNVEQGALVTVDVKTGHVKAMVGGKSYNQSSFNRAWQAQRQPGSAFKPFVYLAAFARGFSPANVEVDEPIQYRFGSYVWRPKNYGGGYSGAMTLQRALEMSVNIIAVKLGEKVGLANVVDTAHKLGIKSELKDVLSLPLGASEVTPLEMASAYATMGSEGVYNEPTPILRVEDRFGKVLEDNTHPPGKRVFNQEHVANLVKVMKGVILRGTAPAANIGRPAAGKTGTTSNHKDAWFVGYTPQLSTAVWIGNDTPAVMYGATGGALCATLWGRYMRFAHEKLPLEDFPHARGYPAMLAGIGVKKGEDAKKKEQGYERLAALKDGDKEIDTDPTLVDPQKLMEKMQVPLDELVEMSIPSTAMGMTNVEPDPTGVNKANKPAYTKPSSTTTGETSKPPVSSGNNTDTAPPIPGQEVPAPPANKKPEAPPPQKKVVKELDQLIQELNQLQTGE